MSTLKVNTIQDTTGNDAISIGSDGSVGFAQTQMSHRNLIINGAMQVAQRGTSETGVTSIKYNVVDRFKNEMAGIGSLTYTIEQSTDAPDGFANSLKYTTTTAQTPLASDAYTRIRYSFEGQDVQHFKFGTSSAQSITVSFWVKSSIAGTYTFRFRNVDADKHYSTEYTIDSANTWEYKTITVVGDTSAGFTNDNTSGFSLYWWLDAGSTRKDGVSGAWETSDGNSVSTNQVSFAGTTNSTFQITGVQLEVGSVATPFEHRSYGEELALCQRYYQLSNLYRSGCYYSNGSGNRRSGGPTLMTQMRSDPTILFSNINYVNGSGITADNPTTTQINTYMYVSGAGEFRWEAYMSFDAEL